MSTAPQEWEAPESISKHLLPPDFVCTSHEDDQCLARADQLRTRWECVRPTGHTGRHYTGDGSHVWAVWA